MTAWFEWCDGFTWAAEERHAGWIVPGTVPLGLAEAVETYRFHIELLNDPALLEEERVPAAAYWFPFARSHAALAADTAPGHERGGPVYCMTFDDPDSMKAAVQPSMAALVEEWILAYRQGRLYVTGDGYLRERG